MASRAALRGSSKKPIPTRSLAVAVLLFASLGSEGPAQVASDGKAGDPRVELVLDTSEAEAVLDILALRRENRPVEEDRWQKLFATEPYRRLKLREKRIGEQFHDASRAFSDEDFRTFVLSEDLLKRFERLRAAIEQWQKADVSGLAKADLRYLPAGAVIRAKIYPVIKPRPNSFVWESSTDPAIFLFLDPEVSRPQFENTVAHELPREGGGLPEVMQMPSWVFCWEAREKMK